MRAIAGLVMFFFHLPFRYWSWYETWTPSSHVKRSSNSCSRAGSPPAENSKTLPDGDSQSITSHHFWTLMRLFDRAGKNGTVHKWTQRFMLPSLGTQEFSRPHNCVLFSLLVLLYTLVIGGPVSCCFVRFLPILRT